MKPDTNTLIDALRILARDIHSEDGVTNAAISEAADRLAKQQKKIRNQRREIEALQKDKHRMDGFVNWLDAEINKCEDRANPLLHTSTYSRMQCLRQAKKQLEKLRNGLGEQ